MKKKRDEARDHEKNERSQPFLWTSGFAPSLSSSSMLPPPPHPPAPPFVPHHALTPSFSISLCSPGPRSLCHKGDRPAAVKQLLPQLLRHRVVFFSRGEAFLQPRRPNPNCISRPWATRRLRQARTWQRTSPRMRAWTRTTAATGGWPDVMCGLLVGLVASSPWWMGCVEGGLIPRCFVLLGAIGDEGKARHAVALVGVCACVYVLCVGGSEHRGKRLMTSSFLPFVPPQGAGRPKRQPGGVGRPRVAFRLCGVSQLPAFAPRGQHLHRPDPGV